MASLDQIAASLLSATAPTPVTYKDVTYNVAPPMEWRQSTMAAVRQGNFNAWAVGVMDDGGAAFIKADFTNREVMEFLDAYQAASGMAAGE